MRQSLTHCYEELLMSLAEADPRSSGISERRLQLMLALAMAWPIMGTFATPRVIAKLPADVLAEITPKYVRGALNALIDSIVSNKSGAPSFGESTDGILKATQHARDLLNENTIADPLPTPLVQAARDFFRAFHVPVPEDDWDRWEGPEAST